MKTVISRIALALLWLCLPAFASLGGGAESIEGDRAAAKGSMQMRQGAVYSVHEISGAAGTTIREYLSSQGTVFAVGWEGPFAPDLQQLLETYFDAYTAAVKEQKASYVGRRPLTVTLPGLVVQRSGHMRAESGRAYIPEQVPLGVKAEELW